MKFQLKMTMLIFGPNLPKKGLLIFCTKFSSKRVYLQLEVETVNITIVFGILDLV